MRWSLLLNLRVLQVGWPVVVVSALLATACGERVADSARPAGDSADADTSVHSTCTCEPVCGVLICPSCGGCDDSDVMVGPWCEETCNARDDNCNGDIDEGVDRPFYLDGDGDGQGDSAVAQDACEAPSGYVETAADCDDTDPAVFLGAPEVCGDAIDQDCDGADLSCP